MGSLILPDDFEVAPGYRVRAWRQLALDDAIHYVEDWNKAVKILETRIRSRFLEPAQLLIEREKGKERGTNGFAILAIDFLVIETIQGFKSGRTSHKNQSMSLFKTFLTGWDAFRACVPADMNADDLAVSVYEQGRCALHHTGSTDRIIVKRSGPMFVFHADGRIELNRSVLHRELAKAFDSYIADLRVPQNADLRKKFRNKMNHIST
ncbi:hypothetical protein LJR231_002924 [Phyllobacterium sp. LjRoot231]|uniref:hypothetical protein n=1 Tax=Phyllobacterium sp. LjRoot231 TaxID=3342289 RepID=UPI003ECE7E8C